MKSQKQVQEFFRCLGSVGNDKILRNDIAYMEKRIIEENENKSRPLSQTPHFSAWIRFCSEYHANLLYNSYFRFSHDVSVYDKGYGTVIELIKNEHEKDPSLLSSKGLDLNKLLPHVYDFIDLRHCFQHG